MYHLWAARGEIGIGLLVCLVSFTESSLDNAKRLKTLHALVTISLLLRGFSCYKLHTSWLRLHHVLCILHINLYLSFLLL